MNLYKFSPWFSIQLTPFFIDFKSCWPPHFYKTLDPIGSNFLLHSESYYLKYGEVSPPPVKATVGLITKES